MLTTQTTTPDIAITARPLPAPALTHSARIVLPVADNAGNHLSWEWITRLIASRFGGLTQTDGEGQWVSDDSTLYHDDTLIVDVDYSGNGEGGEYLAGLAQAAKEYAAQEAVYLRVDGQVYFI